MTPAAIAALVALAVAVVVLAAAVGAGVATLMLRRTQRQAAAIAPDRNDPAAPTRVDAAPAAAATEADHESFGYIVSHDLRAPIRVVEGFTKIVKEDYGAVLDKVGHDHLDRILGAAHG